MVAPTVASSVLRGTLYRIGIPNDRGHGNVSGRLTIHNALLDHMQALQEGGFPAARPMDVLVAEGKWAEQSRFSLAKMVMGMLPPTSYIATRRDVK